MEFFKNIIKFVENKISRVRTTHHKDIGSDFYKIINKVISEFYKLHTQKVRYAAILIFCILLWIDGHIIYIRLVLFIIIIIIIYIYKWLYINIWKINNYININQMILLKIYKYKNPLILILIEIEIKIFYMIDYLKKRNVNPRLIKLIYNIIYNITGINGVKIVLYKFYKILEYWTLHKMYELIFQRMFGMILSVMIFTNIIQEILRILNSIYPSYIIWIYIFLVIIPYILTLYNLINIESKRLKVNLIWNVLKQKNDWFNIYVINPVLINKDVKACLGIFLIKKILNYDNFMIYLICGLNTNKWIEYDNIFLNYCFKIYDYFDANYIYIKNLELKKGTYNTNLLNHCEYQILLYKLKIFFLWDIENQLGLKETLLTIVGYQDLEEININDLNTIVINLDSVISISYDYNISILEQHFYEKIKGKKVKEFFNIIKNKNFYKEMYNCLNVHLFLGELQNEQIKNYMLLENYINNYNIKKRFTIHEIKQQIQLYIKILNEWQNEYKLLQLNKPIEFKYYNIFNQINYFKNQIIKEKC